MAKILAQSTAVQPTAPPSADQLAAAIRWLKKHESEIAAALPLKTPGVVFGADYLAGLQGCIQQWQSGELGLFLAVAYIVNPLRTIRRALFRSK